MGRLNICRRDTNDAIDLIYNHTECVVFQTQNQSVFGFRLAFLIRRQIKHLSKVDDGDDLAPQIVDPTNERQRIRHEGEVGELRYFLHIHDVHGVVFPPEGEGHHLEVDLLLLFSCLIVLTSDL